MTVYWTLRVQERPTEASQWIAEIAKTQGPPDAGEERSVLAAALADLAAANFDEKSKQIFDSGTNDLSQWGPSCRARAFSDCGEMADKLQRCAVYTRKSTEDGLEQEFNSLDAQYEPVLPMR